MPAKARSEVFDPLVEGDFLCTNEIVRGRHLLGDDSVAEKDLNYRKDWMRDQFRRLAAEMAIQVLDFAILGNLIMVMLRNRPDIVAALSDEEVVRRWRRVCPKDKDANGDPKEPTRDDLDELLENVEDYRRRLSDISWMMRLAQQRVARRANLEDGARGRFFAQRFACTAIETRAELLSSSLIVGTEQVHAGTAKSLKESSHTSIHERLRAQLKASRKGKGKIVEPRQLEDHWLAPICTNSMPGIHHTTASTPEFAKNPGYDTQSHNDRQLMDTPITIRPKRISEDGFLPITLGEYFSLIRTLARAITNGRLKRMPKLARDALERLGLMPRVWLRTLLVRILDEPARSAAAPV